MPPPGVATRTDGEYTRGGRSWDEARADFIAAQAAIDRGDAAPANALLRQAVAKDSNFTYAWVNPGVVSFSTEEFALALEGAKQSEEAKRLFKEVGAWNFNTVGFALVRKEALSHAG